MGQCYPNKSGPGQKLKSKKTYCSEVAVAVEDLEELDKDDRVGFVLLRTPAKSPPGNGDTDRLLNGDSELDKEMKYRY